MSAATHYVLVWRLSQQMGKGTSLALEEHVLSVESEDRAAYLTRYINERLPIEGDPLHRWRAQYGALRPSTDTQTIYDLVAAVNQR